MALKHSAAATMTKKRCSSVQSSEVFCAGWSSLVESLEKHKVINKKKFKSTQILKFHVEPLLCPILSFICAYKVIRNEVKGLTLYCAKLCLCLKRRQQRTTETMVSATVKAHKDPLTPLLSFCGIHPTAAFIGEEASHSRIFLKMQTLSDTHSQHKMKALVSNMCAKVFKDPWKTYQTIELYGRKKNSYVNGE